MYNILILCSNINTVQDYMIYERTKQVSYYDASKILQKALCLIDRHLTQLSQEDKVAGQSAIVIQNYAKTLAILAKEQREATKGFNPAELTDEQLEQLTRQAEEILNETDDQTNETTDTN